MRTPQKNNAGLTLIELLIVVAILALLLLLAFSQAPIFIARANDARRKSDLQALKIAIEQYYADKKCYPPADTFSVCDATNSVLSPYLPKVPCDPVKKSAYAYIPSGCQSFRLYATLTDTRDGDIAKLGCESGCGFDTNNDGNGDSNYYVSSDNVKANLSFRYGECNIVNGVGVCLSAGSTGCCSGAGYVCDVSLLYCIKQ